MPWNIISESVIGADHKRKKMPLQDAVMSMVDRDYMYASIADGHGSGLSFRSDVGAGLAVFSAIDIIKHQARNIAEIRGTYERELALRNVLQAISAHWARLVMKNLKAKPFQPEELDILSPAQKTRLASSALYAYGSTLSLLVLNRRKVFGFCLGDGDCLFKGKDGIHCLSEGGEVKGEATESICQVESIPKARYFEYDAGDLDCILLSTDGYKKSFESEDDFKQVIEDMDEILRKEGASKIKEHLAAWLDETSIKGSGDDISACFLYNETP